MKIRLGENIQALRKARGLTQEQLAEAMGVTVGAVSKWENSLSNPELQLIPELAEFFDTSVDVLLGYGWEKRGMGETARRIKELTREKCYEEARREAAKALEKYPNSFEVVYQSAQTYAFEGLEHGEAQLTRQAQCLYRRALELIDQNTTPEITPLTLQLAIGECYMCLGEYEKALAHFKRYNGRGINHYEIGNCLVKLERYGESLEYLSQSLMEAVARLLNTVTAMVNALSSTQCHREAQALLDWEEALIQGLLPPGKVSKLHKLLAGLWGMKAVLYGEKRQPQACEECFRQALALARTFDSAPNESLDMRFYHGKPHTAYDDGGATALGMLRTLAEHQEEPAILARFEAVLKEEPADEA